MTATILVIGVAGRGPSPQAVPYRRVRITERRAPTSAGASMSQGASTAAMRYLLTSAPRICGIGRSDVVASYGSELRKARSASSDSHRS